MESKLELWKGRTVSLKGSSYCPTAGVLQSLDGNGVLIDFIFIPWHKIDAIILPK